MERDILFARQVKAECKENGVVCLVNDGSRTKGDAHDETEEMLPEYYKSFIEHLLENGLVFEEPAFL